MRITSWAGVALIAFGTALPPASPAVAAADAQAVADALVAAAGATGRVKATYESATASGDVITVSAFTVTRTSAKTVVIPAVVVTGAAMRETGGFTADSIAFDGGKATRGKDLVGWETGLVEEVVVPSAEEVKAEADIRPFGKLAMSGLTISESNLSQPITAAEIRVLMQADADGSPSAFAAQVTGIHFAADVLKARPQEKALLDALGYEEFDVNIAVAGAFDAASGAMTLDALTINTAEVGSLTVKARFEGVTPGKIIATRTDAETRAETKLDAIEIRFDNDGVVERALDMQAALFLGTREDAAAQVTAALPFVLQFVGNEAFQDKIAAAATEFLGNPQSIAFIAAPSDPVSLEEILATRRGELPDLLNADVTAN